MPGVPREEPVHSPVFSTSQMLLDYANATKRGLDFLGFLDDELTYKTLFVPVNEAFVNNMVTQGCGHSRHQAVPSGWPHLTGLSPPRR